MIQEAKYKEIMTKYYNLCVKNTQFHVEDLVLRNNKANQPDKPGKLKAEWEEP